LGKRSDRASGASIAEPHIVLRRSAFVAMAFHGDLELRKFTEDGAKELGIAAECGDGFGRKIEIVVSEEDVFQLAVHGGDCFG